MPCSSYCLLHEIIHLSKRTCFVRLCESDNFLNQTKPLRLEFHLLQEKKKWLSGSKEKCLEAIFERLIRGLVHQMALRKQHCDELSTN